MARRELRGLYIKGRQLDPRLLEAEAEQRTFGALSICTADGHNLTVIMSYLVQRNLRSDSSIL